MLTAVSVCPDRPSPGLTWALVVRAGLSEATFESTLEEGRGRWVRAEPVCRP